MANIIGTSGAWKSICKLANLANFDLEKISEIPLLLNAAEKEYEQARINATKEIQDRQELIEKGISQLKINLDKDVKECQEKISVEIELAQLELQLSQDEQGIIKWIMNFAKKRKIQEKVRLLKIRYEHCAQNFQDKIDQQQKALDEIFRKKDVLIESKCKTEQYKAKVLHNIQQSPDLAGAVAELELIESLRLLPEKYYVIGDINLKLLKAIHFDGDWLKSAQVDLAVICTAGIFVIEVKNWSEKFLQGGKYFDPYQQVKRASYLCYRLIGERYGLKTRSIIAYKGHIPVRPSNSYVKVLAISEVKDYILWFKSADIHNDVIDSVANWLSYHCSA